MLFSMVKTVCSYINTCLHNNQKTNSTHNLYNTSVCGGAPSLWKFPFATKWALHVQTLGFRPDENGRLQLGL